MDATKRRADKLQAKGKTVDFKELLRLEPDSGTTNIRNVSSAHWKRWLGPDNRCLVPFTSFSEYDTIEGTPAQLCRTVDQLDQRSESQGKRDHHRHLCHPDMRAER